MWPRAVTKHNKKLNSLRWDTGKSGLSPLTWCYVQKDDSAMSPRDELENGIALLRPVLQAANFRYVFKSEGRGSGGTFANCAFVSGKKSLELSFRYSLGCVEYKIGNATISHSDYMDAIGVRSKAKYPGFSSDSLKAFEDLASDISNFADSFLTGSENSFVQIINSYNSKPKKSGFAWLSNNET